MKRKKVLEKRMQRLIAKKTSLTQRALASQDANEVRAINEQLEDINSEIEETQDELDAITEDEKGGDPVSTEPDGLEGRSAIPAGAKLVAPLSNPAASFTQNTQPEQRSTNPLDSMEYRKAFMQYVQTGEWTYEQRDSSAGMVITSDVGKIIPNTIMNEFIKELKVYGQLYSLVRKLNIQGGVEFPIEDIVPTVTWITETTVSSEQSAPEIKTSISFGYHIVEARIAQSLLSQVVSLSYLESEIAKLLAEAFVKEFDRVIVAGTGSGQPLGITKDTRVKEGNKIKFSAAEIADWTKWRTKLFAKIPLAYRGQGILIMTAATWETYIMTLKDANNRPLYQETYNPVSGLMECRFAGRQVVLVEGDILKDYDAAGTGETWAIYMRPTDYAINSNMQIGFKRWFDDNKNKWINKGLCIMDGKLLDVNGVYLLQK